MIANPLVTIGALNYNNAAFVLETLRSIAEQTYANTELIIVDDCSTDNSVAIIEEWLTTYNRPYRFIKHEKNYGICRSSNDILKNAKGKYFSYVATDDILMPEKIEKQVPILEQSDPDVCAVYSDAYLMNEDSSPRYGWFIQRFKDFAKIPSGNIYDELMETNWIPAMSLLVKKEYMAKVGYFDEDLKYEDYDMWLKLARSYTFLFSDYVSCIYRIRTSSLSSKIRWNLENLKLYAKHLDNNKAVKRFEVSAYNCYVHKQAGLKVALQPYKKKNKVSAAILKVINLRLPIAIGKRMIARLITVQG